MPDGSLIRLVGIFHGHRDDLPRVRGQSPRPTGDALTIWTWRTGIRRWWDLQATIQDGEGREHRLTYVGGLFQGPTPTEWKYSWVLPFPPPLGQPLRLRIALDKSAPSQEPVEFTLPYTEEWKARQFEGKTLDEWMMEAVDRGDRVMMRTLIDRGARVHVRGEGGFTPLMIAALRGDVSLSRALIEKGAALDTRSDVGSTALWFAVYFRRPEMVELLLSRGADPNLSALGHPPLFWTGRVGEGMETIRKLLRAYGAREQRKPPGGR